MEKQYFYRYLSDTLELSVTNQIELKTLQDEYPWFALSRLLYLKKMENLDSIDFEKETHSIALFVPDRRKLFSYVQNENYQEIMETFQIKKEEESSKSFDLINQFLEAREETIPSSTEDILLPSVSSDYLHWTLGERYMDESLSSEETIEPVFARQELIESFLNNEVEQDSPNKGNFFSEDILIPLQREIGVVDDSYFTETLAAIYIKQHRYDRALQIIRNINLKYPKKSAYFADQIRFLERLIINTKK